MLIEDPARGFVLGFLTKEFTVDRGQGPEPLIAVYVPTNHLYLGDVIICARDHASYPDITVEQGIRIFLTGGMALSSRIRPAAATTGSGISGCRTAAEPQWLALLGNEPLGLAHEQDS